MDTLNQTAVQNWSVQKFVEGVTAFHQGRGAFGVASASYELARSAGVSVTALEALVFEITHPPLVEISDDHMTVYSLPLSVRVQNRLVAEGFDTLGKVKVLTVRRVLSMPMMGRRGLREIQDMLASHNVEMAPGSWSYITG